MSVILEIILQFGLVSLLAFGGVNALLPEIHRLVVENKHWMNDATFTHLFAIAQAAPGPNLLVVSLIGLHVAGISGALAATGAICGPSSLLVFTFSRYWERSRGSHWQQVIQLGVSPLAVGLVLSSGWLIALSTHETWRSVLLTGITVPVLLSGRVHPLWLIAAGGVLGLCGAI